MKKPSLISFFLIAASLPAFAADHTSSFGFSIDLPAGWTVFGQQEIKQNPDLFEISNNPVFSKMDPAIAQQIQQKLQSGSIELYFHYGVGSPAFTDNINIVKQIEQIPTNGADLQKTCSALPAAFSQAFHQETKFYQCILTKVGGKSALLLEFTGVAEQTRSIQYQVQKSDNVALVITGSFAVQTLSQERAALTTMMQTVKFQ